MVVDTQRHGLRKAAEDTKAAWPTQSMHAGARSDQPADQNLLLRTSES